MRVKKLAVFISVILALFGLSACGAKALVNDVIDQVSGLLYSEDPKVLSVKNGSPNAYPNTTYQEAFESVTVTENNSEEASNQQTENDEPAKEASGKRETSSSEKSEALYTSAETPKAIGRFGSPWSTNGFSLSFDDLTYENVLNDPEYAELFKWMAGGDYEYFTECFQLIDNEGYTSNYDSTSIFYFEGAARGLYTVMEACISISEEGWVDLAYLKDGYVYYAFSGCETMEEIMSTPTYGFVSGHLTNDSDLLWLCPLFQYESDYGSISVLLNTGRRPYCEGSVSMGAHAGGISGDMRWQADNTYYVEEYEGSGLTLEFHDDGSLTAAEVGNPIGGMGVTLSGEYQLVSRQMYILTTASSYPTDCVMMTTGELIGLMGEDYSLSLWETGGTALTYNNAPDVHYIFDCPDYSNRRVGGSETINYVFCSGDTMLNAYLSASYTLSEIYQSVSQMDGVVSSYNNPVFDEMNGQNLYIYHIETSDYYIKYEWYLSYSGQTPTTAANMVCVGAIGK